MHNALGKAKSRRLLGEIHMRRGQLSYANGLMERALRTYKAIAYRIGQAEAAAGLGEVQRLRGFLDRAVQTFEDARLLAHSLQNTMVEDQALLGLGDIYSKQGRTAQAENCYYDAQTLAEQLPGQVHDVVAAEALARRTRLAVFTGVVHEAASPPGAAETFNAGYA